jgi:hypothetical protein
MIDEISTSSNAKERVMNRFVTLSLAILAETIRRHHGFSQSRAAAQEAPVPGQ